MTQARPVQVGTDPSAAMLRTRFRAMGGENEIAVDTLLGVDRAREALRSAALEVLRIERKYSRYLRDESSLVHQINSGAGRPDFTACDEETVSLLRTADRLYHMSDGLFDVTSGVLRRAWDFSRARVPSQDEIESLLPLVGWEKVERARNSVRLPLPGMEIDFGGFGKEYAADRAAAILKSHGVRHGFVNLGGDIAAIGGQPDGNPWQFGVINPRCATEVVARIALFDGGLATSGDYEKYFECDGQRYCHILNGQTGFPARCWRSVSVSHVSCTLAGAFSTIAMLKEAMAVDFLDRSAYGYLLIDQNGQFVANRQ